MTQEIKAWFEKRWEYSQMDTQSLLDAWCERDETMENAFLAWNERQDSKPGACKTFGAFRTWFEAGQAYMEALGYKCVGRDNTYNNENDLTADFVWEVWEHPRAKHGDWVYPNDKTITLIYLHKGGDPRGDYHQPAFHRPENVGAQYSTPIDVCVGWWPLEAMKRETGERVDGDKAPGMDRYSIGCTSAPTYQLLNDAQRVFCKGDADGQAQEIIAVFSDWIVKFAIQTPYFG